MGKLRLFCVISIVADLMTFFDGVTKLLIKLGVENDYAGKINSILLLLSFFLTAIFMGTWILIRCIKDELNRAGTHGIPCALLPYWYCKLGNKHCTILELMHHGVYHQLSDIKIRITELKATHHANRQQLTLLEIEPEMNSLFSTFHSALYDIFHIDVSISMFISSEDEGHHLTLSKIFFLRSNTESKKPNQRHGNTPYQIERQHDNSIVNYANRAVEYNEENGRGLHLKNSIFDYILSTRHHQWMSNDLDKDAQDNAFFSSSPNNGSYYKSLAAFAIMPPPSQNEDAQHNAIKGILTFDSPKKNIFSEMECSLLMGLMAHIVYEILDDLNN